MTERQLNALLNANLLNSTARERMVLTIIQISLIGLWGVIWALTDMIARGG